jgi:hypothetical protein
LRLANVGAFYANNVAAAAHSTRDIRLATVTGAFDGVLKVTNTTGGVTGCQVSGSTVLTNNLCTATGAYGSATPGGAVLHKVVSLPTVFRGAVTSDALNASEDASGQAAYGTGIDWTVFENSLRGWGRDDTLPFPDAGQRGRCNSGTCQLWDWSLLAADLGDLGIDGIAGGGDDVPVMLDTNLLPTGNDAVTHTWLGGATVTLLLNAVELRDGTTGNNDGLCESGETCVYTPNIGTYQGHGALQAAGSIGIGGTLESIQLLEFATNGY